MQIQKKEHFGISVRSNFLPQYASDSAFESALGGSATEGMQYWNTTDKDIREHDGSSFRARKVICVPNDRMPVFDRHPTTTTQILRANAINNELTDFVVNGEIVNLLTPYDCRISGSGTKNLISPDGTDSGGGPWASNYYYGYISNSQASYAPNELRFSVTGPTGRGYLAESGNGQHWKHVGDIYTDGSILVTNAWQVCGYNEIKSFRTYLSSNISRSSGTEGWYEALAMDKVVMLTGASIIVTAPIICGWEAENSFWSKVNFNGSLMHKTWGYSHIVGETSYYETLANSFTKRVTSPGAYDISLQYYWDESGTQYILADNKTAIFCQRATLGPVVNVME